MTFGQLRFDLSKLAPGLDPDVLDSYINNRYLNILEFHKWKALEVDGLLTTIVGEPNYSVPSDFWLPLEGIDQPTDSQIVFISRSELNRLAPGRGQTGAPQVYTLADDSTIEVYPVPIAVANYTFRYLKSGARFGTADTGADILAFVSIQCLMAGVKADICEGQKDYNGADRNEAKYKAERLKMAVTDAGRMGPARVRISAKFSPAAFYDGRGHLRQMP